MKQRTRADRLLLLLKGIAMGAANKVPGVSGGIVAVVTGFYEELIYSLQKFNLKALKLLLNGRFVSCYNYINGSFLVWLFGGLIISYFSVSLVLDYFISQQEIYVWGLFFGMILASTYFIALQIERWNTTLLTVLLLSGALGLVLSFIDPLPEYDNLFFVVLCGIVSITGMTLPGFSGSYLLLILGNYSLLLVDAVNALFFSLQSMLVGNFDFLEDPTRVRLLIILFFFTLGSIIGLVVFSNVIAWVLKKYHDHTIAAIIGFILGALGNVWPFKLTTYQTGTQGEVLFNRLGKPKIQEYSTYFPDLEAASTWITLVFVLLGIAIVSLLEYYGDRKFK